MTSLVTSHVQVPRRAPGPAPRTHCRRFVRAGQAGGVLTLPTSSAEVLHLQMKAEFLACLRVEALLTKQMCSWHQDDGCQPLFECEGWAFPFGFPTPDACWQLVSGGWDVKLVEAARLSSLWQKQ